MNTVRFSPAKINLFLAITGRRGDGFHDLVSVAAPVDFGDTLTVEPRLTGFTMDCDDPALETDARNLVLRAARAFAEAAKWAGGAHFSLRKCIPMGAGLGGGSSNATAALLALNQFADSALSAAELSAVAGKIGSDCTLFLANGPVIMRGRGELIEPLTPSAAQRLRGRRVLIFKPALSINTAWAYGRLAAGAPATYLPLVEAERRLATWISQTDEPVEALLYNNMEVAAFDKFIALPVMMERLRIEFGLTPHMSGSGSACFAFLDTHSPVTAITTRIRELWGADAFVAEARLS